MEKESVWVCSYLVLGGTLPNFSGTPPLTVDSITHSACSSSIAPATAAIASACVVAPGGVTASSTSNLPHSPARFAVATVRWVDKESQAHQHDIWSDVGLATGNSAIVSRQHALWMLLRLLPAYLVSPLHSATPCLRPCWAQQHVHQTTSPHSSLSVEQSPVRLPPLRAEQALAQSKYDRCNCVHECECYWRDLYTDTCPRHRTTTVTLHGSAPMRFCCSAVVNSRTSGQGG